MMRNLRGQARAYLCSVRHSILKFRCFRHPLLPHPNPLPREEGACTARSAATGVFSLLPGGEGLGMRVSAHRICSVGGGLTPLASPMTYNLRGQARAYRHAVRHGVMKFRCFRHPLLPHPNPLPRGEGACTVRCAATGIFSLLLGGEGLAMRAPAHRICSVGGGLTPLASPTMCNLRGQARAYARYAVELGRRYLPPLPAYSHSPRTPPPSGLTIRKARDSVWSRPRQRLTPRPLMKPIRPMPT